jgi:hypothetical protein
MVAQKKTLKRATKTKGKQNGYFPFTSIPKLHQAPAASNTIVRSEAITPSSLRAKTSIKERFSLFSTVKLLSSDGSVKVDTRISNADFEDYCRLHGKYIEMTETEGRDDEAVPPEDDYAFDNLLSMRFKLDHYLKADEGSELTQIKNTLFNKYTGASMWTGVVKLRHLKGLLHDITKMLVAAAGYKT